MIEITEIVTAVNRLKDNIAELSVKIDRLSRSPYLQLHGNYVAEEVACRILHVCPRTLAKMRADGSLPYIKRRKKILYRLADIHAYLKDGIRKAA